MCVCVCQEVSLGFNSLDVSSALAVVEALSNKKELKKIDLNGQSVNSLSNSTNSLSVCVLCV